MKKRMPLFSVCCVLFLFVFAAFMAWYLPSSASIASKITETREKLETSRGREGKQQDEYDRAAEELPLVQAELQEKLPLAEEAEAAVRALKDRRNELRAEKEALEGSSGRADEAQEGGTDE